MKFKIAVLLGRFIRFIGKFVNRSSALPGEIAMKIYPNLLRDMKFKGQIIGVTGSNGKTTTSNMIAHILRQTGHTVVNNSEGANLSAGVATALLAACDLDGVVAEDFVVLEVDERFCPIVFNQIPLNIFLVNNLLRDQVVRNGNPDIILSKISEAIKPGVKLVLNGNDPVSQLLSEWGQAIYFGMNRTPLSTTECQHLTHDCKVCPLCFHEMTYTYYHYNHIGDFRCSYCAYRTPDIDFCADNVNFESEFFTINGHPATLTYDTVFHVMNTTAAVAVCGTAGIGIEKALAAAGTFTVSRERYEEFDVDGRKAVLMLTKQNPVSLDQNISYVIGKPEEKTVALYVNNVIYTDNKDISWLYDVSFERLVDKVDYVVCSGSRAYDLAVRLRLAGFPEERTRIEPNNNKLRAQMHSTSGTIYVLAASAFGDEDGILEVLKAK